MEKVIESNQIKLNVDNQIPQYIFEEENIGRVQSQLEEGKTRFSPDRLKMIMLHKKKTAYRIAKETGIPVSHMYRIAEGKVEDPQIGTLKKIADFLNVSVFDMMGY